MSINGTVRIKEIDEINDFIQSSIHHSYMDKHITSPKISFIGLHLLFFMLTEANIDDYKKRQLCLSVILMQLGLDTHENILTRKATSSSQVLTRQLSVLAGDYFSSKYYAILASLEEIDLIHQLSKAVSEINEAKMKLYFMHTIEEFNAESYFTYTETINSRLYIRVADWLEGRISIQWQEIVPKILLAEKLIDQLKHADYENRSLQDGFNNRIESLFASIEVCASKMMTNHKYELLILTNQLRNFMSSSKTSVNEL